jgi:hypothetical protein
MENLNKNQRRHSVDRILAIWALEGFDPDRDFVEQLDNYVDGRLTLDEIGKKVDETFEIAKLDAA